MSGAFWLIGAIVGWCGTPPGRRPWPWPPPDPNPWLIKILGVIGGIAGAFLFNSLFGSDFVTAAVGGWAGSVIFNDAYGLISGGAAQKR